MYLLRVPKFIRKILPEGVWEKQISLKDPMVYLSFDDGPHPIATPFVLEQLALVEAKATFFCVGKNVIEHPVIFEQIQAAGHVIGNHTHTHLKGRKTKTREYVADVKKAQQFIDSFLFRPPYGSINRKQAEALKKEGFEIIMWSLLSGDFDSDITTERCLQNVVFNLKPGDILVFHDSQKAWENLRYVLPRVLAHCQKQKWGFGTL